MATKTTTKEWKKSPISELAYFSRGISWRKAEESEDGVLVVSIPNIKNGRIDFKSKYNHYITKKIPEGKKLQIGDIIFVGSSGSLENVGRNAMVTELPVGIAAFASFAFNARPDTTKVDPYFLYFLCNSPQVPFARYIKRAADGKYNFQLRDFEKNLTLSVPSIPEQKKIAQTLVTIQDAIAKQEKLIEKLQELKRSMMQHLFTHGTKGEKTKMTEIGEVPESWEITTVGDLTDVKGGKRLPKGEKLTSVDTGLPYIRVTDLNDNSVDVSNIQYLEPETQKHISRYTISSKDIYISIAGSIGFVGIIPTELDGANLTENAAKLCIKSDTIDQRFLMYWLSGDQVQRNIKSQTVKNAQPKLALARIQKITCVLPTLEEQKKVAEVIDGIRTRTEITQEKLLTYQNLFKTLLHELMSGERRINI
jgi:type I restriction enzyme S subunit